MPSGIRFCSCWAAKLVASVFATCGQQDAWTALKKRQPASQSSSVSHSPLATCAAMQAVW